MGATRMLEGSDFPRAEDANFVTLNAYFTLIGGGDNDQRRHIGVTKRLRGFKPTLAADQIEDGRISIIPARYGNWPFESNLRNSVHHLLEHFYVAQPRIDDRNSVNRNPLDALRRARRGHAASLIGSRAAIR